MTIQIDANNSIAGLPILEVRDLLRRFPEGFRTSSLQRAGYSRYRAKQLVSALIVMGYLEVSSDNQRKLTPACKAFARGSAAKRVKRDTADAALHELMVRVEQANRNDEFLMKVTAVVVFGSYLSCNARLGDLDVAVELEPKNDPKDLAMFHRMYAEHFEKSGRAYRYVGYEFDWAQHEVLLFLKNHKRTLSLHSMHDFVAMEKAPDFRYRILAGDPEQIAAKLRTCPQSTSILPDPDSSK